jgi:putative restriction endonuclease
MNEDLDLAVRLAMFAYLGDLLSMSPDGTITWGDIKKFTHNERVVHLIGARGIWTPEGFDTAFTITTTFTPPDRQPPYADAVGTDGLIRYKYKGTNPNDTDNVALRRALQRRVGLAYFIGVARGVYVPRWPVWIVDERPETHDFAVAIDEGLRTVSDSPPGAPQRAYAARLVQERLHQPVFRSRVLRAYQSSCAICRLRHAELLDAAHILPDGHRLGEPVVPNGLALCKIHHAAFDRNILGVRPDLVVEIKTKILQEIDGPMLRYGLQEMHGQKITVPRSRPFQPDSERLEERYEEFRSAS